MTAIQRLARRVGVPDAAAEAEARRHLDRLTKPRGSLGRLEDLAVRLAGIRGLPLRIGRPVGFVLAADHGVVAQGISPYPQIVTTQMLENFSRGGAAINVLARQAGVSLVVADLGVAHPVGDLPGVLRCPVGRGTADLSRGPAMTPEQAAAAVETGARLAGTAIAEGADLLLTGEMGIGNTTAAAAVTAAVTGARPVEVTGRGAGIDEAGWERKVAVVGRALAVNRPDPGDGLGVLARVGGFEIGGLAGVILAGAAHRVPVVLDGFISTAAALVAAALAPGVRPFLFASHRSAEPGHARALAHLGLEPYLDLGLRLGEGTGAALFVHLARAAAALHAEMATFKSAGVSPAGGDAARGGDP